MNYIKNHESHPYHLVEPSPWPFAASISLLIITMGGVIKMHTNYTPILALGLLSLFLVLGLWWRDTIREATYQGYHTDMVQRGIRIGFILFVISEIFFFIAIFWAFFHSSLAPTVELGAIWPPKGIEPLNPWEVPLLNTVILLSSGASLTWAHHSIIGGKRNEAILGVIITLILAVLFTSLQVFEYYNAPFTFSDGVFGTCFYFSTGFHGIHIIVGSIFLLVSFIRLLNYHITDFHHIGFESAIIYWHFVDVVWLFLFVCIYWWGS